MDAITARKLNRVTADFYRRESASFSQTRKPPWKGWQRALDIAAATAGEPGVPAAPSDLTAPAAPAAAGGQAVRVVDLGCGNLRFERFLAERLGCAEDPARLFVDAYDNCPELVAEAAEPPCPLRFHRLDIVEALLAGVPLFDVDPDPAKRAHLSVAFGIMHHLALPAHRLAVLEELVRATRPGGFVVVAFWQFLNSCRLAAKARDTTARGSACLGVAPAAFDEHDYLLGWQHAEDVFRFCHHFPEEEIDALVARLAPRVREVARFSSDGKENTLNRYLVLQVRSQS